MNSFALRTHLKVLDLATVGAVTLGLLIATAGVASAAPNEDVVAGKLSDDIAAVAPALAEPVLDVQDAGSELVGTGTDGTSVSLPSEAEAGDALSISGSGLAVEVGLPEGATGDAVVTDDGTIVYDDNDLVAVAVQPTEHGARIQTVVQSADAPTEFTYEIEGLALLQQDDGSVLLLDDAGQPAGYVAPAWAFDANGAEVVTSYSIVGSAIVQTVAHNVAGVAYPVVADPSVRLGWRVYVRYSPAETKAQTVGWRGTVNDKAKYTTLLCLAIPNVVAAGACALLVYDSSASIMNTAKTAASRGRGITIEYLYNGLPVSWYVN